MSAARAVVLLSGGLDSATTLAVARQQGFELIALTFRYGQRHEYELHCAARVAAAIGVVQHVVFDLPLGQFGGSALTSADIAVPLDSDRSPGVGSGEHIPVTYVPARNTVFLAVALALAEVADAQDIFIGVNAVDYSGYPDCRPEFIAAFERMANLATRAGVEGRNVRINTPLIRLSKAEIIRLGVGLGVDYGLTHSCYQPDGRGISCGRCDACVLRRRGFAEAGITDPLPYAAGRFERA